MFLNHDFGQSCLMAQKLQFVGLEAAQDGERTILTYQTIVQK